VHTRPILRHKSREPYGVSLLRDTAAALQKLGLMSGAEWTLAMLCGQVAVQEMSPLCWWCAMLWCLKRDCLYAATVLLHWLSAGGYSLSWWRCAVLR